MGKRHARRWRSFASADALLAIMVTECAFAASLHGRTAAHARELLDALRESEPGLYEIALAAAIGGFPALNLPGDGFVSIVTELHRPTGRVCSLVRVHCPDELPDVLLASCSLLGLRVRELAEFSITERRTAGERDDAA